MSEGPNNSPRNETFRDYASPTTAKAFCVEEAILTASSPLTVTDLVNQLGIAQSLVSRILKTMESLDLIRRDPGSRGWLPSGRLDKQNRLAAHPLSLTHRARAALEWLVVEANETTQLLVESNGKALILDQWLCNQVVQVVGKIGARVPIHSSAPGKVWLAFCSDSDRQAWYETHELTRYTPTTVSDRATMDAQLVQIRKGGYAIDNEEGIQGVGCVAAPVLNAHGQIEGAITVVAPKERIAPKRTKELAELVMESTTRLI